MIAEFEERSTSDNLQRWENNLSHIYVGDEHVACDLSDMLQEAKVIVFILQPGQFQVSIDVGAVGVSIPQVSIMMFRIACLGHAAIGANTN